MTDVPASAGDGKCVLTDPLVDILILILERNCRDRSQRKGTEAEQLHSLLKVILRNAPPSSYFRVRDAARIWSSQPEIPRCPGNEQGSDCCSREISRKWYTAFLGIFILYLNSALRILLPFQALVVIMAVRTLESRFEHLSVNDENDSTNNAGTYRPKV